MVDVYQSDLTVCVLELMVLTIGREVHIGTLCDRFSDELRAASTAQSDGLDHLVLRACVAHVRTI